MQSQEWTVLNWNWNFFGYDAQKVFHWRIELEKLAGWLDFSELIQNTRQTDVLRGGAGNDYLYTGTGNDWLFGNAGRDILYSGGGSDRLYGGAGGDLLFAGDFEGSSSGDRNYLNGGPGNDILVNGPSGYQRGYNTFVFREADFGLDTIIGFTRGNDKIDMRGSGLGWTDLEVVKDNHGSTVVYAGDGNVIMVRSMYQGLDESDFLFGEAPVEPEAPVDNRPFVSIKAPFFPVEEGEEATFTVELSKPTDKDVLVTVELQRNTASDGLYGGDDVADYDRGRLEIATGDATFVSNSLGRPLSALSSWRVVKIKAGETSVSFSVPIVDDSIDESDEDFWVLVTDPRNARIIGTEGDNVVIKDNDDPPPPDTTVLGETAEPVFNNGAVEDTAATEGTMSADSIHGSEGKDSIILFAGNDTAWGNAGSDRIEGGLGDDTLYGNAGNDSLWGGRGKDILHGGVNADELHGGIGADELRGGRHNDALWGDKGNDLLYGDQGQDRFVFDDADFGNDRIGDFKDGVDILDFRNSGLQWEDLSVSNNRYGDAVVSVEKGNASIVLIGIDAAQISQEDFLF